jgi:hypothetical protein
LNWNYFDRSSSEKDWKKDPKFSWFLFEHGQKRNYSQFLGWKVSLGFFILDWAQKRENKIVVEKLKLRTFQNCKKIHDFSTQVWQETSGQILGLDYRHTVISNHSNSLVEAQKLKNKRVSEKFEPRFFQKFWNLGQYLLTKIICIPQLIFLKEYVGLNKKWIQNFKIWELSFKTNKAKLERAL